MRIVVQQTAAVSAIAIDPAVYRASRAELRDLRIVRAGVEVPYRLQTLAARREQIEPALLNRAAAVRDTVATLTPITTEDSKAQTTSLVADIGFEGLAYDRVSLAIGQRLFSRRVEISTSRNGKAWSFAGRGALSRTAQEERVSIEFPEHWDRYIRITVFNGDSPPLEVARLSLSAVRRLMQFPSGAAGSYWLYSGNPAAKQPSYDLAAVNAGAGDAPQVALGAPEANPRYRAPERPWTDRNPRVLNFVLIAAVAAMGYVTIRFLRKVKSV